MNQDWNDAKSQLQQCCLTLRDPTDGEPDIPVYKLVIKYFNSKIILRTFLWHKFKFVKSALCVEDNHKSLNE